MEIEFCYEVKDEVLHQEFVAGELKAKQRSVKFTLDELSEQARNQLLVLSEIEIDYSSKIIESPWLDGNPNEEIRVMLQDICVEEDNRHTMRLESSVFEFDHAVLSLLEVEKKLNDMFEQGTSKNAECERHNSEIKRMKDEEQTKKDAEEEAREAFLNEDTRNWIERNGSEQLRLTYLLGYGYERLYALERAAIDFKDYILDLDDNAQWDKIRSPSLNSLRQEKELSNQGLEVYIVNLEKYPDGSDPYEEYCEYDKPDECEAIVIRHYHGKHDLIKVI